MSRYNQPQKGTTDWHMPLNDNFADLEVAWSWRTTDAELGMTLPDGTEWRADRNGVIPGSLAQVPSARGSDDLSGRGRSVGGGHWIRKRDSSRGEWR